MKKMYYRFSILSMILFITWSGYGQTVIYRENFGNPSGNILIQQFIGWQNNIAVYSGDGTCDVRNSTPSTDYEEASGGGNVMLNNTNKWFQISNLNTADYENISLHFGLRKGNTPENGSNFSIRVSPDGNTWENLPAYTGLPTGTGSTGWYYVTIENLPSYDNLHIRFSSLNSMDFRIDDISLSTTTVISTPYIEMTSPIHGGVYENQIEPEISIVNFIIGESGIVKTELAGENNNTIHYFSHEDSLLGYFENFPILQSGDYTFAVTLLNPDSTLMAPSVATMVSFTIISPTVSSPAFSPNGGSYYTTQHVTITSATADCNIYYTVDGSSPNENSTLYSNPIEVSSNVTIKAIAFKTGMEPSTVATADYIIRDTSAALQLPFDISSNSTTNQEDITVMTGFSGYHLGSSYTDGSAKFEQARAGTARLSVKLKDSPDSLWFDLKGRVGGTAPQSYEGIEFQISESGDNRNWTVLGTLTENEIQTSAYQTFRYKLKNGTRFIRWKLLNAGKGNTQLNNIKIGKYTQPSSPNHIAEEDDSNLTFYPNPVISNLTINAHECMITRIDILDASGKILQIIQPENTVITIAFDHFPKGVYFVRVTTAKGETVEKIIK